MPWKTKNEKLKMAKTLYLKISFFRFNDCFLKIFSFRGFLKPPLF
ncbi:hypothetical protein HPNQ4076_1121 [Helicobacter pylori NQ4076]|uniref:Uncharacterized protein n=1 Tax=Helicobacter pylori NQ4076 TaxID=992029 RepID=J0J613_HELPX|nr:hypothetical protein HPNQ4076_1121 [Helicobacter pylori NQ4076]